MTETSLMQRPFTSMSALDPRPRCEPAAHAALLHGEQSMSYGELDAIMTRIGAALQRDGVQPGGTIAICATSSIEYAAVYLGAVRAGVVVAPLAPSSTAQSLADMAADAGAQIPVRGRRRRRSAPAGAAAAWRHAPRDARRQRLRASVRGMAGSGRRAVRGTGRYGRNNRSISSIRPAPPAYPRASCNRTACAGRMCRAGR
ncbi:AMP-binding protein [Cupriavidus basilensis]